MLFSEWSEYDSLKFLQVFLRNGDQFLDVGSNIGLYSILASETLSPGSIYCVEPGGTQRTRLKENLELNQLHSITVYPFAVGEIATTEHFTKEDSVSHIATIGVTDSSGDFELVDVRRLDSFLPPTLFSLSKIDVEGHELSALRGAVGLIDKRLLPVLLIELNGSSERYGIRASETIDFLRSKGYEFGIYHHDKCEISLSETLWDDVLAFTHAGRLLIEDRIPGIRIA